MIRVASSSSVSCRNHIRRQSVISVLSSGCSISESSLSKLPQQKQQQSRNNIPYELISSLSSSSRCYTSYTDRTFASTTTGSGIINNAIQLQRINNNNNSSTNNSLVTIQYRNFFWGGGGKSKTTTDENTTTTTASTTTTTPTNDDTVSDLTTTTTTTTSTNNFDVDQAIDKLFDDTQQQEQQEQIQQTNLDNLFAADNVVDSTTKITTTTIESTSSWFANALSNSTATNYDWHPVWWNIADHGIVYINSVHTIIGSDMAITIIVATTLLRTFVLFPFMVFGQRNGSRMAHLSPELQAMKKRYTALGTPSQVEQQQFLTNMKLLFKKYNVKPVRQLLPLLQLPILMGLFFGIRKLQLIYPIEMQNGGILWFSNLTMTDPLFVLPAIAATTMLVTIEINKEQTMAQDPARGEMMINFMRVMAAITVPFLVSFDCGTLVYWCTNNTLTCTQAYLLKQRPVRRYFDIWDPPKPIPGSDNDKKAKSIMETIQAFRKQMNGEAVTEKDIIKKHNAAVEAKRNAIRLVRKGREERMKKM
jgi:YidC/Oxa1 family membrane protein insertase